MIQHLGLLLIQVMASIQIHANEEQQSTTFLEEVDDAVGSWPDTAAGTASGRLRREVGR